MLGSNVSASCWSSANTQCLGGTAETELSVISSEVRGWSADANLLSFSNVRVVSEATSDRSVSGTAQRVLGFSPAVLPSNPVGRTPGQILLSVTGMEGCVLCLRPVSGRGAVLSHLPTAPPSHIQVYWCRVNWMTPSYFYLSAVNCKVKSDL